MAKWLDLPPVWTAVAAALMWLTARAAPWPGWGEPIAAAAILAVAAALMIWSAAQFRRRRTTIIPRQAPSALIAEGPYRFSRNPIYLADALALLAFAVWLGSALALLWLPAFIALITRRFIIGEEAGMAAAFGDDFARYRASVRRWI